MKKFILIGTLILFILSVGCKNANKAAEEEIEELKKQVEELESKHEKNEKDKKNDTRKDSIFNNDKNKKDSNAASDKTQDTTSDAVAATKPYVGTWVWFAASDYEILTLKEDGSFYSEEYEGSYTVNENGELTIIVEDEEYECDYRTEWDEMIISVGDSDEKRDFYKVIQNPDKEYFVGKWEFNIGEDFTIIFEHHPDGTYEAYNIDDRESASIGIEQISKIEDSSAFLLLKSTLTHQNGKEVEEQIVEESKIFFMKNYEILCIIPNKEENINLFLKRIQ